MYYKLFIVLCSMALMVSLLPLNANAQDWVSFNQSIIPEKPTAVVLKKRVLLNNKKIKKPRNLI